MGGVEDGQPGNRQPSSKRMRLSCAGSSSFSSGVRAEGPVAADSLRDLMAQPVQCQGDEEVIGSRGIIKKLEFVRLIAGALYALGYESSGACLEEESATPLHSGAVKLLMQHVLDGNWDESAVTLENICLENDTVMKSAKFLILEQKFFELLDDGKMMDALMTLRTEISPLCIKTSRVHELSSCILYHPQSQNGSVCKDSLKPKLRSDVLDELQKLLPPTIMVPARRLEYLVEQALDLQRGTCLFHNSSDLDMSLYADHHCGRDNIPSRTLQGESYVCLCGAKPANSVKYMSLLQSQCTNISAEASMSELYIPPNEQYQAGVEEELGRGPPPQHQGNEQGGSAGEQGEPRIWLTMLNARIDAFENTQNSIKMLLDQIQYQMDGIEDHMHSISSMLSAMNQFFACHYPDYHDPTAEIEFRRQQREAERAARRGHREPEDPSGA